MLFNFSLNYTKQSLQQFLNLQFLQRKMKNGDLNSLRGITSNGVTSALEFQSKNCVKQSFICRDIRNVYVNIVLIKMVLWCFNSIFRSRNILRVAESKQFWFLSAIFMGCLSKYFFFLNTSIIKYSIIFTKSWDFSSNSTFYLLLFFLLLIFIFFLFIF